MPYLSELVFFFPLFHSLKILLPIETYNLWHKYVFTNNVPLHCLNLDFTAHHYRTSFHSPQLPPLYLPGRTSTMADLINNRMEKQRDNKCLFLYLSPCFRHCSISLPLLEIFKKFPITVINFFPPFLFGAHAHWLCDLTPLKQLMSRPLRTSSCQI